MEQKSVYLIIFNATMISRSVGTTFKKDRPSLTKHEREELVKRLKQDVFKEVEELTKKMDVGELEESDVLDSIINLRDKYSISFGQAQKPINVLLKYHFYLNYPDSFKVKKVLHCPIDSNVLERLGMSISLTKINYKKYIEIQQTIEDRMAPEPKITFDRLWDERHLRDEGL